MFLLKFENCLMYKRQTGNIYAFACRQDMNLTSLLKLKKRFDLDLVTARVYFYQKGNLIGCLIEQIVKDMDRYFQYHTI